MKCCICGGEIEKIFGPDGTVAWDKGHNAEPVMNGRCCGGCNELVLIKRLLSVVVSAKRRKKRGK